MLKWLFRKYNTIDISELKVNPSWVVMTGGPTFQNDLLEDIKKNGIINPILVDDDFEIIDGHRRFWIAKYLGMKQVPYKVATFQEILMMFRHQISISTPA